MNPQPNDTHPDIERVHMQLLNQAGPNRRLALAHSLSQTTMELSRAALRKRNPDLSEQELALMWVSLCYGEDLAQRLRSYLENRKPK